MHQPYDDSMITLTSVGTPDPFVNSFRGRYYLVSWVTGSTFDYHSFTISLDIHRGRQD